LHARLDADEAIAKGIADWEEANLHPRGTISDVADHIDHIREVAGIDHIGIGADFDDVAPDSRLAWRTLLAIPIFLQNCCVADILTATW
jgi:microsomal dipeptidase-like Zn-dependent dipeptidase